MHCIIDCRGSDSCAQHYNSPGTNDPRTIAEEKRFYMPPDIIILLPVLTPPFPFLFPNCPSLSIASVPISPTHSPPPPRATAAAIPTRSPPAARVSPSAPSLLRRTRATHFHPSPGGDGRGVVGGPVVVGGDLRSPFRLPV
jgi:hypothetical protein